MPDIAVEYGMTKKAKKTKIKRSPVKWYAVREGSNCADNSLVYQVSVMQPGWAWRPVSDKIWKQQDRFLYSTALWRKNYGC